MVKIKIVTAKIVTREQTRGEKHLQTLLKYSNATIGVAKKIIGSEVDGTPVYQSTSEDDSPAGTFREATGHAHRR